MIERHGNKRTLICDGCDDIYDQVSSGEFGMMIAGAKEEGWRVRPDGDGGYDHHCPDCIGSTGLAAQRKRLKGWPG